jgi:hypothetical protein
VLAQCRAHQGNEGRRVGAPHKRAESSTEFEFLAKLELRCIDCIAPRGRGVAKRTGQTPFLGGMRAIFARKAKCKAGGVLPQSLVNARLHIQRLTLASPRETSTQAVPDHCHGNDRGTDQKVQYERSRTALVATASVSAGGLFGGERPRSPRVQWPALVRRPSGAARGCKCAPAGAAESRPDTKETAAPDARARNRSESCL